jgi:hypothetical protein
MAVPCVRSEISDEEWNDLEVMLKETGSKKSPFVRILIQKAIAEWKAKKGEAK